jgi:predicted metal-dependent phosphoesterase TrpH
MIDLHTHSCFSDGQYSPEELVRRAKRAGLQVLGLTDHDTVAGLDQATKAAREEGLTLVPGIELSAFVQGAEAHILGHFVDPGEPRLRGLSSLLCAEREKRMVKMIEKLARLGLTVPFEEVVAASSGENLARPHLAKVLVWRGYARSIPDAFDRYLANGAPGFVERYKLPAREGIELIRGAGGTATLAHPQVSKLSHAQIAELARDGLAGLEVAHSDHPPEIRSKMRCLARELGLVPTAGSDFHGEEVAPGRRLQKTEMSFEDLNRLRSRARSNS